MRRKLVKQGRNALTVTLPAKWLKLANLKAGDEVEVEEDGSKIILAGKGIQKRDETTIKLTKSSFAYARTLIGNTYKKGYDIINIEYDDPNMLKTIEKVASGLIGHEILETKENSCILKNISTEFELEFLNLFRKYFYLTKEHMKIILEETKDGNYKHLDMINEQNLIITKYADYCKRIIMKNKRQNDYSIFEYLVVWNSEKVAHEVKYLYRYLAKKKPNLDKNTIKHLENSFEMFIDLMTHYFKEDTAYLNTVVKKTENFRNEFESFNENQKIDSNVMHRIANIIQRTRDLVGPFYGRYL